MSRKIENLNFLVKPGDREKLTDYTERKAEWFFSRSFDTDGNQFIEWRDFEVFADIVTEATGRNPREDTEFVNTILAKRRPLWNELLRTCDMNGDGRISLEEWKDFWGAAADFVHQHDSLPETMKVIAKHYFHSLDVKKDGVISRDAVRRGFIQAGGSRIDADRLYAHATKRGRQFTESVYVDMFMGMVASMDEDHPSKYLLVGFPANQGASSTTVVTNDGAGSSGSITTSTESSEYQYGPRTTPPNTYRMDGAYQ
ncbi:unnamed protein product [Owenia fusiformis]|uniref:Uncharacterized protein n=1 Tax=Owenia fusiformis TaxID=6347 RepID=A0A8J1U7U7_OWEFU|nr:unnamed protein product [Owenia fusiformis]